MLLHVVRSVRTIVVVILLVIVALPGCLRPVTRAEVLATAAAYAEHRWRASPDNVFHGPDPRGVHIDTPDADWWGPEGGWHADGRENVGVPYAWGGHSSIEEFDRGVAAGRPAGHAYRRHNPRSERAESALPVGVDCSGLVSQCWRLWPRRSTYDLERVCTRLDSYDDLRPGDALNRPYKHVMLFVEWLDDGHEKLRAYESGGSRVKLSEYDAAGLRAKGFIPLQYRGIRDAESCAGR